MILILPFPLFRDTTDGYPATLAKILIFTSFSLHRVMEVSKFASEKSDKAYMKIGIFCSANDNIDPVYFQMTRELGAWIAKNGHSIVFGGCDTGLMNCIGRAVKDNGGQLIGVVPTIVEKGGKAFDDLDVYIPCDNLSDRKDIMLAHSDVLLALPGGVGTLDEIFTVVSSHTIGYHNKVVIVYNMQGFWNPLIALLDDLQAKKMIRGHWSDCIKIASNQEEVSRLLAGI